VDFHLNKTGWIRKENITKMIKASFSCPAGMWQAVINELYETNGNDSTKTVWNRFIGLWDIVQDQVHCDHFITKNQDELFQFLLQRAPVKKGEYVLGKDLFISKCHRTDMEEYFACFIDHQAAEKTRLLLPFAAQLRTYSVIWLT